jgi:putative transcriptional regulator
MIDNKFESMDVLLARYVAGALPKPIEVLVASHLELSASSRAFVRALEVAAGDELAVADPLPLSDRNAMLASVLAAEDKPITIRTSGKSGERGIMPKALHEFVGFTADEIPWKTKMPGFREYEMGDIDGCHVSMFWLKPGRKIPAHTHEGLELTLVLDGAFRDSKGRFGRGDISIADESIDHRPIAEHGAACIGFAVTDGPLRLTGPFHQRIADILGAT